MRPTGVFHKLIVLVVVVVPFLATIDPSSMIAVGASGSLVRSRLAGSDVHARRPRGDRRLPSDADASQLSTPSRRQVHLARTWFHVLRGSST